MTTEKVTFIQFYLHLRMEVNNKLKVLTMKILMDQRSYLDLKPDEVEYARFLHEESIVIDASIVPFINYVGEDIWLDDVLKGGVTASNATVCMQKNISEALR